MTTPETMNEIPLRYSATSTAPRSKTLISPGATRSTTVSSEKSAAAGTAEPYVVARLIWFADSRWWRTTRFGTVASFAGPQTRLTASTSTVTTKTHHNV